MFKLVSSQHVPLTPEFAKHFSELPSIDGDRDRNSPEGRRRVAWSRGLLRDGVFYTPKWATAELDGKLYRTDGGHTSGMLAEANGEWENAPPTVCVDHFVCDTYFDLVALFDHFNSPRSVRKRHDQTRAHAAAESVLNGVSPTAINCCLDGIVHCKAEFNTRRLVSPDSRARLIHDYAGFIAWAASYTKNRLFKRIGIAAAMFATFSANEEKAKEFWELAYTCSGGTDAPATRLMVWLRECIGSEQKWNHRAYYCKCIQAWNAWRRNTGTALRYFPNKPLPRIEK